MTQSNSKSDDAGATLESTQEPFLVLTADEIAIASRIGAGPWMLYAYLKWRAGNKRVCWPSQQRICKDLGIGSTATVQAYIKTLEQHGLITREKQNASNGRQPTRYYLNSPNTKPAASPNSESETGPKSPNSDSEHKLYSGGTSISQDLTVCSVESVTPLARGAREDEKSPKRKTKPKTRKRDVVWDAVVALCGDPMTTSERGDVNRTVKELKEVGASPDDISGFQTWWSRTYPNATMTHRCLRLHWTAYKRDMEHSSVPYVLNERGNTLGPEDDIGFSVVDWLRERGEYDMIGYGDDHDRT